MDSDLEKNYRAFDGALAFGRKPALLMVDFVQAYFEPSSPLYAGVDDARDAARRLLSRARDKGVMRVFTRVLYAPDGADGGVFFKKVPALRNFVEGSSHAAWAEGLEPIAGEIIVTKQYPSAFFGTSLAATLTAAGVDCVLITGLTTSGCVRASCVDACSHGFAPFVVREACGDRHATPHEANLFDMQAKYAEVISEADAARLIAAL
ncbi:MAG: isochorismatase family protein [Alphaproteobacteria bacterium]|nr:isochorismatase family protein [Alphaproteobacteria bacterium]